MAIQETTPPRYIVVGYKEFSVLAAILLLIVVAIFGITKWAISRTFAPLREDIRALSRRVDAGFADNRSKVQGGTGETDGEMTILGGETTAVRSELTDLRNDINDLSNRVTRIETILEQQRQGTTTPDTP